MVEQCSGVGGRVNARRGGRNYCFVCSRLVTVDEHGHAAPHIDTRPKAAPIAPRSVVDAAESIIHTHQATRTAPASTAHARCYVCGWPAEMRNSLGPTCAEHYDNDGG